MMIHIQKKERWIHAINICVTSFIIALAFYFFPSRDSPYAAYIFIDMYLYGTLSAVGHILHITFDKNILQRMPVIIISLLANITFILFLCSVVHKAYTKSRISRLLFISLFLSVSIIAWRIYGLLL